MQTLIIVVAFGGCTAETNTYYYQNYAVDPSIPNAERCLVELYKGSKNVPDDQRHYDRNLIDTCFTNPNCPKRDVGPQVAGDHLEKRGSRMYPVGKREAVAGKSPPGPFSPAPLVQNGDANYRLGDKQGLPSNAACVLDGTCKPGQSIGVSVDHFCAFTGTCKRDALAGESSHSSPTLR